MWQLSYVSDACQYLLGDLKATGAAFCTLILGVATYLCTIQLHHAQVRPCNS